MDFASWLFRTYLDLSAATPSAPFHVFGPEFAAKELIEGIDLPRIQAVIMPSFRYELASAVGDTTYNISALQDLPDKKRTPMWSQVSEMASHYAKQVAKVKVRILRTLCKLCLYDQVLVLEKGYGDPLDDDQSEVNYWLAIARYTKYVDEQNKNYSLNFFKVVREQAPKASLARINATYQMVVQNVKHSYDLDATEYWQNQHQIELDNIAGNVEAFVYQQLLTRFYRVGGFVPQMKKDKEGVAEQMDLAEKHARQLFDIVPKNNELHYVYDICAKEMLYPVLESRTKEALWKDQLDLAYKRVKELSSLALSDARAQLQLGEVLVELGKKEAALSAYSNAAMLAPPGAEIAYFMMGQIYAEKQDYVNARMFLMKSLEIDPQGISSLAALKEVNSIYKDELQEVISHWFEDQKVVGATAEVANKVKPYQVRQIEKKTS